MSTYMERKEPKDQEVEDEKQPPSLNSQQDVLHNAKIIEVVNADYALALSTGSQLSPTSLRSLQLYLILLVSFMGSLSNGFDGSGKSLLLSSEAENVLNPVWSEVMSAVNGMQYVHVSTFLASLLARFSTDNILIISTLMVRTQEVE